MKDLVQFIEFLNKFRSIERTVYVNGTKRLENDAEHSYQLAMVCWYLNTKLGLGYNIELILKYCLAHDLDQIHFRYHRHRRHPKFHQDLLEESLKGCMEQS